MQKKTKVVDLFAGVGGLSYGFCHDDFFEIVAANEILPDMAKAYELNHPKVKVYCKDIKDFGVNDLTRDLGIRSEDINVIVGGPPCQSFSTVGKRLLDDPRGKLFQEYFRLLKELKPDLFLFENVTGLISVNGGKTLSYIIELFSSLGYHLKFKVLNAVDYGVPQIRERIILIGSVFDNDFLFPNPTHYNPEVFSFELFDNKENTLPYVTMQEAISDLPLIKHSEQSDRYSTSPLNEYQKIMRSKSEPILLDHNAPTHGDKLLKIMEALNDGECAHDLPETLKPSSGFKNTYCKLWWNKPSTTITRNFGTPSSSRCIHPICNRGLTTREGARLQSFPDNYKFYGSRISKNLQIGNAVPPFLSIALAKSIKEYLSYKNVK